LSALKSLHTTIKAFVDRFIVGDDRLTDEEQSVYALEEEQKKLGEKETMLSKNLEEAKLALLRAREELTAYDETGRELRRHILEFAQTKAHEESEVTHADARERELKLLTGRLDTDKAEVVALVGTQGISYEPRGSISEDEHSGQEDRARQLERIKIRLEEAGGAGEEIRHEHKEVSERETFLARELDDLAKSAESLGALIQDLDTELAKHFTEGLSKVNESFNEYFALMFGGGNARLTLEEPEVEELDESEELEESSDPFSANATKGKAGIEISVNLPRKKVRSLMQLSGGERALTSIALIFAMSQVNPPPFLILDETDASLDEANSRRYGDMIGNLAKKSQLIVITHNRETMSRAGILYGVTMGGDGVSKLLSVKFDEAVAVAK